MNQLNKILLPTHNATGHPLRKIAPLALVAMVVGVALFIAYGLAGTAHVQAESGAIPSLTLDSNEPGQLVINWQAPDPAPTDYRLSWANTSLEFLSYKDSNEAQRGNVYPAGGVITLTLNNLTPGDTYKVQMRSRYYNEDGSARQSSGPWTPITTQRVKNHPPAAPTSLTISEVAHDSLILSWDDPQDANITGYRIQRGTDADSLHSIEANTESASTNYTDSTVEPETTYHYAVQALSQDGNGARSITSVTTPAEPKETVQNDPPPAPTGLMAARVGHSVLALTWNDPQDDTITGYRILRGAEADNLSVINSDTGSNATEYEDDTVAPETTYHYAVMALSADGAGPQSSTISATTTAAPKSKDPPPQGVGARQSTTTTEVPANWSLKPTGLPNGDKFRLLFLSSTKRNATVTTISNYNTFVQTRAAAGHTDIQSYSTGFKVVGCTGAVDARDNTSTTYTSTAKGVPIYWLNGAKVADQYEDFYDGSWDDEANDKNESGTNGPDTSQEANYPFTGCAHNGTEAAFGSASFALGTSDNPGAGVGRPNSPMVVNGPLGSDDNALNTSTRPMYGLSQVFQVEAGPSLTSAVVNETGQTIQLVFSADLQSSHLPPASAFSVIADGTEVMISAVATGITPDMFEITVSPPIRPSQTVVVTYEDPTGDDDANAIQDTAGIDTPDFTTGMNGVPDVINNALSEVPANWSLKPTSLNAGDKFRLLFLSSTKRNATVTAIATYNTFIQNRAAAGHSDIRAYSAGFRVVGCTAAVDARDNTSTTYISTDKGVPIYWLNGTKVADQYEDFYDESWDDEVNDKNESGTDGPDTSQSTNRPFTGCAHNGTEAGGTSRALGTSSVITGQPNSSDSGQGPLGSTTRSPSSQSRPMYGLSAVFQVATASTDATLSALSVSPKDISGFAADRTSYEVGVASTVTQATITATKSHSAATVAYSTTDAETSAGHQVNLSAGRNEVTITVTAEDTTTTGTYTVSINRGVTDAFGWKASDDFDGLITAENNRPYDMWSDGTTMWVADGADIKLYAYNLGTKARDASKDFDTLDAAGNDAPRGIWSDGTTMWVPDYSDDKVYAYDMITKARDASKDFDTPDNTTGIWSNGTTMWVAAQLPGNIYAYDMTTKARDAGKDFDTLVAAGNGHPGGIWSNNITMWVTDEDDGKLYAYNMASKARDAGKDFNTLGAAGNGAAYGIWATTTTMWASDGVDGKIYSYNMPVIAPNTPAAGAPAITVPNVFRVPAVLGVDLSGITDTDGTTGIASNATYKWQRFAADGTTLDTDSIGTDPTYTLTDADAGKTLKVVVSYTDNGGNSEGPLTSAATRAITAAATDCNAPTLTGGAVFLGPARKVEVGEFNLGGHAYHGFNKAEDAGSIDNASFTTADPNNYEILGAATKDSRDWMVALDAAFPANVQRTLAVHFCDEDIAFNAATPRPRDGIYYYTSATPPQHWAPHAERTIYVSQDTVAPTFASATVSGTTLVIAFNEPLGAAGSLANSAFTVKKGPSGSQTTLTLSSTAPVISGSTVTLTLATASSVTASDTNVLVTYTKPTTGTANKLVDAFGNEMGTFAADQVVANVTPAATAPTAADGTVTTNEDTVHTFAAASFSYSDTDGDALASVKITGLPAAGKGTLALDGTAIASTALPVTVTAAELTENKLKYAPPANANGTGYASFRFRVNDGASDSDLDYTMTINVTAVNDSATGTPTINGTALVGQTLTASIADIADADGLPGTFTYQWKRYAANGTTFEANIGANSSTYTLTASEEGKKVKIEVSFTDNDSTSEGPLSSGAYPASGTVAAVSTDATLSALTVSPKDISGFAADRTSYEVGVASTVTQATITATKSHSAATVAYSTTDAETSAGHQVNLSAGRNEVTITVTAEDTTTTGTYTVSINRGVTDAFGWKASDDFDGLITAENNRPVDMWSDGTTMWVADGADIKLYAYNLATKARDASKDFDTLDAAGNGNPRGIWSDGTTMWVPDYADGKVYAYNLTTKARDASKDFDTADRPTGIWSNGTTMWVAVQLPGKIYAYDMSTKARDAGKDFDTLSAAGNSHPGGMWSNNITMWVAEEDDDKLYAYNMASKARDADKDFNTLSAAGNGETGGIWATTTTMWASDSVDDKIYSYNMPVIAPNTPAAGTPAVTAPNVFRVPAVLGVDLSGITDTDGTTGIADNVTYKWQRFAADGTTLDTDSIGTGSTYTLTDADAGKTLKVVVSYTDNGGNSEGPLTSAATRAITAAASCAAPTYVGGATQIWTGKVGVAKHNDFYGYYDHTTLSFGLLDNTRFSISPNNYKVDRVFTQPGPSLALTMNANFTADEQKTLALHICDQAFALSVAGAPSGNTYPFDTTGFPSADLDWSTHAERTIYLSQDTAAPTFASATVNGTSLVITFNEPLGAAGSLANSAFTVKKNGSATALTYGATAPVISGSTVTLTLATASSVTASDTNVLVTYTKPGTGTANKLVDAFGNETGTFAADQVVTNLLSGTNAPPTVENMIPDQSASADTAFSYTFPDTTFADADSDALTYSATKADGTALPTWLSFAATTRTFSGTPTAAETVSVKVTASDGDGGSVSDTFDITVSAADTTPPTLVSVVVDETGQIIQLRFSENVDRTNLPPASAVTVTADGNALTITGITVPPPSAGLDRHRALVSPAIQQGQAVVVTYTDPTSGNDTDAFQDIAGNDAATFTTGLNSVPAVTNGSTVAATNTAPTVANIIPDQSATVSTSFSYAFPANTFADADLDTLTYSATKADGTALPMWLTFTAGTRTFSGTPTAAETVSVKVTASDGNGGSVSDTFDITVRTAANTAPTAANATVGTDQDTSYTFTAADFNYSDPDNNPLASVKITTIPAAGKGTLALDGTNIVSAVLPQTVTAAELNTSKLKYNPPANENGTAYTSFEFKVNDGTVDSAGEYTITINVNAVVSGNTPAWGRPTISGTAAVGQTLTASTAGISDPDGLPTTFTFEWSRYASNGTTFEAVVGSNSSTYTLVTGDADKKFKVAVTFTDTEGTDEAPLYSDPYPRIRSAACDQNRGFGFGPAYDIHPGYWCNAGEITIGGTQSGTIQGGFTSHGRYVNDIIDYFELFGITSGNTYQVNLLEPGAGGGHIVGFYRSDSHGLWFGSRGDMQNDAYTSAQLRQALFTPTTNRRYFVGIRGAYATEDITYTVALVAPAADDIPADVTSTAFGSGVIEKLYDVDWHKTRRLNSETQYVAYAKGAATNGLFDPFIVGIYDPNGNLIAGTSDRFRGAGRDASVLFTPSTTGRHYIAVSSGPEPFQPRAVRDSSGNGHTGAYVLTITSPNSDNHFRNSTSQRMGPAGSGGGIATVNQEYTFDYALEHDYDEEYVEIAVKPNHIYELYIKETNPWDTAATLRAMPDISYDIYTLADHGCRDSYNSHAVFRTLEFSGTTKDYFVRVRSGTNGGVAGKMAIKLIDTNGDHLDNYANRCD